MNRLDGKRRGAEKPREGKELPFGELVKNIREKSDLEHELKRALKKVQK